MFASNLREPSRPQAHDTASASTWQCRLRLALAMSCLAAASCDAEASPARAREGSACEQPAPRWVLRDKHGNRVQALVEPRCYQYVDAPAATECHPLALASTQSYPCVRVIDHEGRYINLQYHLASGTIEPCQGGEYASNPGMPLAMAGIVYLNDTCTGLPYRKRNSPGSKFFHPEFTKAQDIILADDTLWYTSGQDCVASAQSWHSDGKNCYMQQPSNLCPLREVPEWVRELLPNPPYTLKVEYE